VLLHSVIISALAGK